MAIRTAIAFVVAGAMLAGCAYNRTSEDYRGYEVMGEQNVRFGVVEAVRDVRIQPHNTGIGTTAGAFIGGIAGSHAGRGSGEIVGAIAGSVIGSIVGYNVEKSANEVTGVEVTVLLDSGQYIAVVQQASAETFRRGERVRILGGRNSTRVTH